jgi:hypothetical protein
MVRAPPPRSPAPRGQPLLGQALARACPKSANSVTSSALIITEHSYSNKSDRPARVAELIRQNRARQYTLLPRYTHGGNSRRPTQAASRRASSAARR